MSATLMSLEVDNPPSLIKIVLNFEWEGESSLLAFRIRAHMSHSISGLHSPFFFLMCTILKLFIGFVTMLLCFFCCLCSDLGAMRHVRCLSSPTRDRTLTLCLGKQSLNHRTASRVPYTWAERVEGKREKETREQMGKKIKNKNQNCKRILSS